MHLPLMSPAALDNAAYEVIARELGVANTMRFIARHNQPDGIDYTRDRNKWLPQKPKEVERLLNESNPEFDRLVAESRKKKRDPSRQRGDIRSTKGGVRNQK